MPQTKTRARERAEELSAAEVIRSVERGLV